MLKILPNYKYETITMCYATLQLSISNIYSLVQLHISISITNKILNKSLKAKNT